jgi:hypothetical protein
MSPRVLLASPSRLFRHPSGVSRLLLTARTARVAVVVKPVSRAVFLSVKEQMPLITTPQPLSGGRRHGASVKTLKSLLKKAGLKTTGRKAALTRRAKKAHLMSKRGGNDEEPTTTPVQEPTKEELAAAKGDENSAGGRRRR